MKAPLLPHPMTRRALLHGFAASALTIPLPACAHEQATRRRFRIFNATVYTGRPDLSRWGIEPIHLIDRGIWAGGRGPAGVVDPGLVRAYVQGLPSDGAPIVMDFEMYPQHGELAVQRDSLARLSGIARAFRAAGSQRQLGFFGVLPIAENNRPQHPGSRDYGDWQRDNDVFAPLNGLVDCLFPSLYTAQPEREIWLTLATAVLSEARRLSDKPVYGFLWPEYSDHHPTLRGQSLEREFWQLQLRTLLQHADGIVIWGGNDMVRGSDVLRPWDERAPWWEVTKRFAIDAGVVR